MQCYGIHKRSRQKNVHFYNIKVGMNLKLNLRRENSHATK